MHELNFEQVGHDPDVCFWLETENDDWPPQFLTAAEAQQINLEQEYMT